jgi:hypothetical protein
MARCFILWRLLLRFTTLEGSIAHLHGVVVSLDLVVYSHSRSFTFEEIPEQCSNCKVVESAQDGKSQTNK